jgi:hypothetical protein
MNARRVTWAVALLAVAVRLPGVFTQALWQDEVASARIITEPTLPRLLAHVARTESTPPLWYTLGWLAHQAGMPTRMFASSRWPPAHSWPPWSSTSRSACPSRRSRRIGCTRQPARDAGRELRAYELLALLSIVFARLVPAEVEAPSRRRELALGLGSPRAG